MTSSQRETALKRLIAGAWVALLVAACGGSAAPATPPAGGGSSQPVGPGFSLSIPLFSAEPAATAAPTDSKVRIVNLYDPGDADPTGLDIYVLRESPFGNLAPGDPVAGDQPVAHADYGAATDPFDPGSLDGTEAWAAYVAGKPPTHDNVVWSFGQDVVPGGRTTIVLSSTSNDPTSKHFQVSESRRDDADPGKGQWTLAPSGGTLVVDASQLEATWGQTQNVVFLEDGGTCLDYASSPGQPQPALLGTVNDYMDAPTGSNDVVAYANDQNPPGCSGTLKSQPISTNVEPGSFGYLFLYGLSPSELKGLFLSPME